MHLIYKHRRKSYNDNKMRTTERYEHTRTDNVHERTKRKIDRKEEKKKKKWDDQDLHK